MADASTGPHTLILCGRGRRAGEALARLVSSTRGARRRLTVLALAPRESKSGCCDTRSVLWNRICRDLAHEQLRPAALASDAAEPVELGVVEYSGRHPADAVAEEALARQADEIVLADAAVLGRRELRRLRRRSVVPVSYPNVNE